MRRTIREPPSSAVMRMPAHTVLHLPTMINQRDPALVE
jgi:hypothetical protein